MELKDKLKALRLQQNLTQVQLAERLFVSRSTVAKWENGLGLPNEDSMRLLTEQFGVTREEIATSKPEETIVAKNRCIRWGLIGSIAGWVTVIALVIAALILPISIHSGEYGFTPEMAAGVYAGNEYIDTGDYRIYYSVFEGNWDDGQHWSDLHGFRIVHKHFWGCTVSDADHGYRIITKNNYVVGKLCTIKGKDGFYNLLVKAKHYAAAPTGGPLLWNIPAELITATAITINGVEYMLENGFFFITQEPVEYFRIDGAFYNVE